MIPVATAFTISIKYMDSARIEWVILGSVVWGALVCALGL
jgi:hypothetical protein